jgi:dTDP-4-amino-4,6-dideoxygalactose transaminase
MRNGKIFVTEPSLPPLGEYLTLLEKIWKNKQLTNSGEFHVKFEEKLRSYIDVSNLSLVANGTIALLIALKALKLEGEVITTPFTFVATTSVLEWLGLKPIFCDIDENDFNIDPTKIEALITENTSAILPVHVFGNPCNNNMIAKIANAHNLKLIYDAAHAFNVIENNISILGYGDMSTLSFHATKVFNTIEGGAIICNNVEAKNRIDQLRNFGYDSFNNVACSGINGKMNELQAAYGLLQLDGSIMSIAKRGLIFDKYMEKLNNIEGIILPNIRSNVTYNYSYFPIRVTFKYALSRTRLIEEMNKMGIYPRRYFYPLVNEMNPFRGETGRIQRLTPIAKRVANEILCLPIYENLSPLDQDRVVQIILEKQ